MKFLPALFLLVGAIFATGASCHRDAPGTPPGAAGLGDVAVCEHLAQVGCQAGRDSSCAIALARLRSLGPVNDACLIEAGSRTQVSQCGVECPP